VWTEAVGLDRRTVELIQQGAQRPDASVDWDLQGERVVVAVGLTEGAGRRFESLQVGELQADVATGMGV
jgi:hypothetical protein